MNFKSFFIVAMLCVATVFNTHGQVYKNADLTISLIGKNRWIIETADNTTMYLIEGTEKSLLIDTGTKCEKLDSVIRIITKKPLYVVLSHAHPDHDGNIGFFNEIYLHPSDTILLNKNYKGKLHFISDGYKFNLGGTTIETVWTPAHTPGSIVFMDKEAGYCYSGDAFGSGQVWLQLKPLAPMKTYIHSCEIMEKWLNNGIDSIYCGHYPYAKQAFSKEYIANMLILAKSLDNGTNTSAEPYPTKISVGPKNPMLVKLGLAGIVYDPEHIK